jgi:hypothetical protein
MASRIIHIDDCEEVLDVVKSILDQVEDLDLSQFKTKHEYLQSSNLEADLYILDRHFPQRPGMNVDDTSWRELTGFIEQMFPEKGVVLLSSTPPEEKDWRQYRNIRMVLTKPITHTANFRDMIKHYLTENGNTR